jgi:hypothetical protein
MTDTIMSTLQMFADQLQTRIRGAGLESTLDVEPALGQFKAVVFNADRSRTGEASGWNPYDALTRAYNNYYGTET